MHPVDSAERFSFIATYHSSIDAAFVTTDNTAIKYSDFSAYDTTKFYTISTTFIATNNSTDNSTDFCTIIISIYTTNCCSVIVSDLSTIDTAF